MGKQFWPAVGNWAVGAHNKKLKPGETPATVDTLFAKQPAFLAKIKRNSGQAIGSPVSPNSNIPNIDDVRKRLAAQLGSATILGPNSDALGG